MTPLRRFCASRQDMIDHLEIDNTFMFYLGQEKLIDIRQMEDLLAEPRRYRRVEYLLDYLEQKIKDEEEETMASCQTYTTFKEILHKTKQEELLFRNIVLQHDIAHSEITITEKDTDLKIFQSENNDGEPSNLDNSLPDAQSYKFINPSQCEEQQSSLPGLTGSQHGEWIYNNSSGKSANSGAIFLHFYHTCF